MTLPSSKGVDKTMAKVLVQPSSPSALEMVREARRWKAIAIADKKEKLVMKVQGHLDNSIELYNVILTLESDPEIVKRNMLARAISGIFPLLNTIEEFRSFEDQTTFDMLMNGMGIISELAQATQYLEATRLSSLAHTERALVKVEQRLADLALETPGDVNLEMDAIEGFIDSVRSLDMNTRDRPFIPYMLWMFICVISYKRMKDLYD